MSEHDSYVTVYESITGWTAVQLWWNDEDKDLGGFWEPWNTGVGKYETKERAMIEAKEWAEAEEMECREPKAH